MIHAATRRVLWAVYTPQLRLRLGFRPIRRKKAKNENEKEGEENEKEKKKGTE